MPKISEVQLSDIISSLPPVVEFDAHSEVDSHSSDELFLCTLGFEDRCLAISQNLADSGYKAENSVIFEYGTNIEDNDKNKTSLSQNIGRFSQNINRFDCDVSGFGQEIHGFLRRNSKEGVCPWVTIDISTFSARVLFQTISILLNYDVSLRILYSEPAIYHPTFETFNKDQKKWLSEDDEGLDLGVGDIIPSQEAQGQHLEKGAKALFQFAGFSGARSKAVRNEIDVDFAENPESQGIVWFVGKPRDKKNEWRMEAVEKINGITGISRKSIVSTLHYRETVQKLDKHYQSYWKNRNITIGNFGSKMQTLGIALFCHARPDVRVINVVPKRYNASAYSEGYGPKWKIEIGSTRKISNKLRSIGQLTIL